MRKLAVYLLFLFCITFAHAQPFPDSVFSKYRAAKNDEEKGRCLYQWLGRASSADSVAIAHALSAISWLKKQNDIAGADYAELFFANVLVFKGDFSASLDLAFPILSRFEQRKDGYGIMQSHHAIGLAYIFTKNYEQACESLKKVIALAQTIDPKETLSTANNDLGVAYALALKPDSGLLYAQRSVDIDMHAKDGDHLPVSLSTVAENYLANNEYDIAIPFLRKSMNYYLANKENPNSFGVIYVNNDFAQAFLATKQYDSATYYAQLAARQANLLGYKEQLMRSYELLYKSFEETKQQDSLNKYFRLAMTAKDSLYSMEKTRTLEAMRYREKLNEMERETEAATIEQERKQNVQLAFIAVGIISFIILFLLLSRSFITNTKLIQFLGVVALLVVFEFLNLLLHPFLERLTNHSPVFMLLSLACIAALLVPLHHKVQKAATTKLIEKNKAIRLAAAKRTIEKLEQNTNS